MFLDNIPRTRPGGTSLAGHRVPAHEKGGPMLRYAVMFFLIALIAALFGFTGIAAGAAGIAKILFLVFIVMAAVSVIAGLGKR